MLDILGSTYFINPIEFVKTKNHCYVVKEYANFGTVAELLLYRSQLGMEVEKQHQGKLSEQET